MPSYAVPLALIVVFCLGSLAKAAPDEKPSSLSVGGAVPQGAAVNDQCSSDLLVLKEAMWHNGDRPDDDTVRRIMSFARQYPSDPKLLYWASHCEIIGRCGTTVDGLRGLQKAAQMGYAPAIRDLAFMACLANSPDRDSVMTVLRGAAKNGDARASYFLAHAYARGYGGGSPDDNLKDAVANFRQSLDGGYFPAAVDLAQIYTHEGDAAKGLQYYELSADLGDVYSMGYLVDPSRCDLIKTDPAKVGHYLQRGRLWQDPQLSRMLGASILLRRAGLQYDEPLAVNILRWAADHGDSRALALVARARLQGLWGIARQPDRGVRELTWLAEGPDRSGSAAFLLGEALWNASGIPADQLRGYAFIRQSAGAGFQPAIDWMSRQSAGGQPDGPADAQQPPPTSQPSRQSAANMLRNVLLEAATAVAPDKQAQVDLSAPAVLSPAEQNLEDDEIFEDFFSVGGSPLPPADTLSRIIARAVGPDVDAHAMAEAAFAVLEQWSSAATPKQATDWLRRSAESGDPMGMAFYGTELLSEQGALKNPQEGITWLRRSVDRGSPNGLETLGFIYMKGAPGLARDTRKGLSLLQASYSKGNLMANWQLTFFYYQHGDWSSLASTLLEGSNRCYKPAGGMMAWLLTGQLPLGKEKVSDTDAWNNVFLRGALYGNPVVTTLAAEQLASAKPPDVNLARLLLLREAGVGCVEAKAILAAALVTGAFDIQADPQRGVRELAVLADPDNSHVADGFTEIEANIGRGIAAWELGRFLYEGKYVRPDQQRGKKLIAEAAAMNNPDAIAWEAHRQR